MQQVHWSDLQLFLAVSRRGGIRRASEALEIHPSTVSRRLAAFEKDLGTQLFERGPGGLILTSAGEVLSARGELLQDDLHELLRAVAGDDHTLHGAVYMTAAESVGDVVCEAVSRLLAEHPEVELHLAVSDSLIPLRREGLDIAVRAAERPPEDWIGRKVGVIQLGVYIARKLMDRCHGELERCGWVEWPERLKHKPASVWLEATRAQRRSVFYGTSSRDIVAAIRAGIGMGIMPHLQAGPELVCLERLPEDCGTPLWVLTPESRHRSARVRLTMEELYKTLHVALQEQPA